jgi:NADH-quinone oxidoreductase subunit G
VAAAAAASPAAGEAVLASWAELLDAGLAQDGDEHLAGTAKPARALLSAATAAALGVAEGANVSISTDAGAVVLPVVIDDLPDGVVWAPSNARGAALRAELAAHHGSIVRLTRSDAPPVAGLEPSGGEA